MCSCTSAVWPQLGYDAQHRGQSPLSGPTASEVSVAWRFTSSAKIFSTPAIAWDGAVVFGASNDLVCIDGKTGW